MWALPAPIRDKLCAAPEDAQLKHFLYSGVVCLATVAVLFVPGGIAQGGHNTHAALTAFGLGAATVLVYGIAWLTRRYRAAPHLLAVLLALQCFVLFYGGGTGNMGVLYMLPFPLAALFLQGFRVGLYSAALLLALTLLVYTGGYLGFDPARYSGALMGRVLVVYVLLCVLCGLFTYAREKDEREHRVTVSDLRQLSYADVETGLANRQLLERMVNCEISLYHRYNLPCSVLLIQPDQLREARFDGALRLRLERLLVAAIRRQVRACDVPGRWVDSCFMILMPGTSGQGSQYVAQRLLADLRESMAAGREHAGGFSVGVAEMRGEEPAKVLIDAEINLASAVRCGGGRIVYA